MGRSSSPGQGRAKPAKSAAGAVVKYRGPNGETWGGGRGRKPRWVAQALKEGRNIEEFAVRGGR
jgi:DNA-binding protein H-NS